MSGNSKNRRVGLTGGVGAGKSLAAAYFNTAGIPVLNLDEIGRELTATDAELVGRLQTLAGDDVVVAGKLDRQKLRQILFHDEEIRAAVEGLLHPLILKRFEEEASRQFAMGHTLVICEAALLIESDYAGKLDGLVVVTAPAVLRKKRIIERDRIPEALADKILQSQTSDEERKSKATWLIDNSGPSEVLKARLASLVEEWKKKGWV